METSSAIPPTRRWRDCLLMALFLGSLILPTLDRAFHLDPTLPANENRVLAAPPPRPDNFGGLKQYQAGWEAYFNDHFGFRNFLVAFENKSKWEWFEERDARGVLIGNDQWMFVSGWQMVEHFRGILQFTEPQLQAWQKLLEHRRDWLAQRGIRYIFVLAPDKQTIYPEELPDWLKHLGGRTKLDQFVDYMQAHSTVEVLDLRPALLAAKKIAPVYQKTDTHWNNYGAFVAEEEVIRALAQKQMPELRPLSVDSFTISHHPKQDGDLARSVGMKMTEMNAVTLTPKPELPALDIFVANSARLKGVAYAKNPRGTGKAVIFTDSYGHFWTQFMGYHFAEADLIWQYNLDAPVIERQKPVVVISEMLERFFDVTDPNELQVQDALP